MQLAVQKTRNGKGICALRDFKKGEMLYEVTGIFITGDEDEDISDSVRDNAFRFSDDLYISPNGSIGDYQNHSCEPNARVVKKGKRLFVKSFRPIQKGEEVLIDYSTIIAADDIWEMKCNCGSGACRSAVGSFKKLPKALKQKYRKAHIVPKYVDVIRG